MAFMLALYRKAADLANFAEAGVEMFVFETRPAWPHSAERAPE